MHRKNPLNIRAGEGSYLILSRVDRLAEIANPTSNSQLSSYTIGSNLSFHRLEPSDQLPFPNKEFGLYSTQVSNSD